MKTEAEGDAQAAIAIAMAEQQVAKITAKGNADARRLIGKAEADAVNIVAEALSVSFREKLLQSSLCLLRRRRRRRRHRGCRRRRHCCRRCWCRRRGCVLLLPPSRLRRAAAAGVLTLCSNRRRGWMLSGVRRECDALPGGAAIHRRDGVALPLCQSPLHVLPVRVQPRGTHAMNCAVYSYASNATGAALIRQQCHWCCTDTPAMPLVLH